MVTNVDQSNAFNSVSQQALADAAVALGPIAPELAAVSLRSQCSLRGEQELMLRGSYSVEAERLYITRRPRGGGQGFPDMPVLFGKTMAIIDKQAAERSAWLRLATSQKDICEGLWSVFCQLVPDLDATAPVEWVAALTDILEKPRPRATGSHSSDGEVSAIYADDAHSAGWVPKALLRTLQRVLVAREASLDANPSKCQVLAPLELHATLSTLLAPLRSASQPRAWEVVSHMRVLGVVLMDPCSPPEALEPVAQRIRTRVVDPIRRLLDDIASGADQSAAFFLARRFVFPNLMFHMQVWGLHAPATLWGEVDSALDSLTEALCPLDLRGRLGQNSSLRLELSLPQECGGLGIPIARAQAPLRAAEQWRFEDARATRALRLWDGFTSPPPGSLEALARTPQPIIMSKFGDKILENLESQMCGADSRLWRNHLDARRLRGGLWAMDAPPWDRNLSLTDVEWDAQWRLNFGGLTEEMRKRLDNPDNGFAWRGTVMEHVVADAIRECCPPSVVSTSMQPPPDRIPLDHAARCAARNEDPTSWRRADVAVETVRLSRLVIDVGTVNVVSNTAVKTSVKSTLNKVVSTKSAKYKGYYNKFLPFAISLSGGVHETSHAVLKWVAKEAAEASKPRLSWEPYDWAVRMLRQITAGMARVVGWLLMKARRDDPRVGQSAVFSPRAGGIRQRR